jgi:hypothetical protein
MDMSESSVPSWLGVGQGGTVTPQVLLYVKGK